MAPRWSRFLAWVALASSASVGAAEPPSEATLSLNSLRPGERARVEAVWGDARLLPFYRLDLNVDPAKRTVTGKVTMVFTARTATAELHLRVTPNAAHPGAVTLSMARANDGELAQSNVEEGLVRLGFKPALAKGEQLTVQYELKSVVPELPADQAVLSALQSDGPGGDYGAFSASPDVVSLVGILPMLVPVVRGRRFEGPSGIGDLATFEPSNFQLTVTAPSAWKVTSAGLNLGERSAGPGLTKSAYALGAARDLPVLLLKNPKVVSAQVRDITVEAVVLGADEAQARSVAEHAGQAVTALDEKLGPYPFTTLRVVEMRLNSGAGGMEFPGLVTVAASLLSGKHNPLEQLGFSGDQAATARSLFGNAIEQMMRSTLEFTIDHEVAHQYSAMLVGSDPVAEPIADEPLTQHLALLILEWRKGKATADLLRDGQIKGAYQMHRMLGGEDGRADRPTSGFDSNREYAALIYGKAPLLFDAQRALVGNEAWLKTLRAYVEQYRYRWVGSRTLTELARRMNPGFSSELEALRVRWWETAHGDEDVGGPDIDGMVERQLNQPTDPKTQREMDRALKELMGE